MAAEPERELSHPEGDLDDARTPLELDDTAWDAFLADDPYDPLPEPGDFWIDQDCLTVA